MRSEQPKLIVDGGSESFRTLQANRAVRIVKPLQRTVACFAVLVMAARRAPPPRFHVLEPASLSNRPLGPLRATAIPGLLTVPLQRLLSLTHGALPLVRMERSM